MALAALLSAAHADAQCIGFALTSSGGASIVPGTTDIGNHGDDVTTTVALPFPVALYGATYTSVVASSNGNLQFTTNDADFTNDCLPQSGMGVSVHAHWDDMRTDGPGGGIFTSISGVAPARVFNIEWRATYYNRPGTAGFEARLFEDQSRIELIYGPVADTGLSATVGVQHTLFGPTQFECNAGGISAGLRVNLACTNDPVPPGGTGSATSNIVFACEPGDATLLAVTVYPGHNPPSTGLAVTGNLTSIGGIAAQPFYNDGSHGDATSGDTVHTYRANIPTTLTPGPRSLPFTISDAQSRTGSGAIGLTVTPCPSTGPDVFVANLTDVANYGTVGAVTAYAIGTDACNMGDFPVNWFASINEHPVIAQNMYRLKNGRFEQLGQSWLKHGFSSTNSGTCGPCTQPPMGGAQLGIGCSDAYGAGLNGSQGNLGPRSQVNATTAAYPYPWTAPAAPATIGRRLQVYTNDIDPALNAGALYFAECQYVTYDDARWSSGGSPAVNGLNNASYRGITIPSITAAPGFTGPMMRNVPAIFAWQAADATVQISRAEYLDTGLVPTGIIARFWVAAKVSDNGNGTWHYEYAVHNLNADRNGGAFTVPMARNANITNIGFHGVFAHSGEPYPNTAANPDNWAGAATGGAVTWTCPEPFIGPNGDNANAIRWGTMYNFRFDADVAPVAGPVTVGLFKPGTPSFATASGLPVPGLPCSCIGDADCDDDTDSDDISTFFTAWDASDDAGDVDNDGDTDSDDIIVFFAAWDGGC